MDQGGLALVRLRGGLHHLKDPLRAGNGRQEVVHLLAHLADGLADLPGVLEVHHQGAQIQTHGDGQQRAHAAGEGVVDVADVAHGGHHGPGKGLGADGAAAVGLVAPGEALPGFFLVVEDLDHLLALNHLLDISVDLPQVPLLGHEVPAGPLAHGHHHRQHQPQGEHRHQKQQGAQVQHHAHYAQEGEGPGAEGDEAVVEDLGDGLHVVGVAAHELAVGVGVKVTQGQGLHPGEQVPADGVGGPLGHVDHDPGVGEAEQGRAGIHARQQGQHLRQPGVVPGDDAFVNQGLEQVGPAHGAAHVEHQAHRHNSQQPLGPAHIPQQGGDGLSHVLRLLEAAPGPAMGAVGSSSFHLSHGSPPPPAATGTRRGKFRSSPSAPGGCLSPRSGRRP